MTKRAIAAYTRAEFDVLRMRLETACDVLRRDGSMLQSVARGYYVVFALASYLGGKYGVGATHRRAGGIVTDQDFSHTELPSLVYALYTGLKRATIQDPGSSPGIGSGNHDAQRTEMPTASCRCVWKLITGPVSPRSRMTPRRRTIGWLSRRP